MILYSANNFESRHYAIGYASADHPLGTFHKSPDNPILETNIPRGGGVSGIGHCSIVRHFKTKELLCVYHGRTVISGSNRVVFIDPFRFKANGAVEILGPTEGSRLPPPEKPPSAISINNPGQALKNLR